MLKKINASLLIALLLLASCSPKNEFDASGTFESTEVIVSSQASGELMRFDITEGQLLDSGKNNYW